MHYPLTKESGKVGLSLICFDVNCREHFLEIEWV